MEILVSVQTQRCTKVEVYIDKIHLSFSVETAASQRTQLQGVGQSIWLVHSITFPRMQLSLWIGTMQQSMEELFMCRILNLFPTVFLMYLLIASSRFLGFLD